MSCSLATLNGGLGGAVEAHTLLCLEKKMVRNVHSKKIGNDDADTPDQVVFFYSFCLLLHTFVLGYTSMSTKPKRGLCEWVSVGFV